MYVTVAQAIEGSLATYEEDLKSRESAGRLPLVHVQKLKWLNERRTLK
jgi:hypothetical protein